MKVSINQLSDALGPTRRTWKRYLDEAGLEPVKEGGAYFYQLRDAIKAIPPHLLGMSAGDEDELNPTQESARLNKARADAQERENDIREGRLADMDLVLETWISECSRMRSRLLQLPAQIANRCAGLGRGEVEDEARGLVFEALDELSGNADESA